MYHIDQDVLTSYPQSIAVHSYSSAEASHAAWLIGKLNATLLGISVALNDQHKVTTLALATTRDIVLVDVAVGATGSGGSQLARLLYGSVALAGFRMERVALQIHHVLDVHVRGVDLSTLFSTSTMEPWAPAKAVEEKMFQSDTRSVESAWASDDESNVALRAFISACIAERYVQEIESARQVDTKLPDDNILRVLAEMTLHANQLHAAKPDSVENDFSRVEMTADGLVIHNERYKTRVRMSNQTKVVIDTPHGQVIGVTAGAQGKRTTISSYKGNFTGIAHRVRVLGREELTLAERARDEFILLVLRGERWPRHSLFIRLFWFPAMVELELLRRPKNGRVTSWRPRMNESQNQVVNAMLDTSLPLVVIHGGPGTGKTSTISASAKEWDSQGNTVWIAAQSNVAVKNIAESLIKRDVDFRLLVSKEFHFEWHEHIYAEVEHKLIRTDELPNDMVAMDRLFLDANVILCTLSMFSNPGLDARGVFKLVPVQMLIIDEASQINVSDYMHIFDKFGRTKALEKVCMFGDPMQLPPYGIDEAPSIKSVFEVSHLAPARYFLDTQYRMPIPLGAFISDKMYGGRLQSDHSIDDMNCLKFIDVSRGGEDRAGKSWKNMAEVHAVVNIVRYYYQHKDFCVITPYDGQRAAITQQLKTEGLPWEKVFNVDSFQGNEASFVIVSLVRTAAPGFLASRKRANVLLTRCRAGLVVVSSRSFLEGQGARSTLVGRLAACWDARMGAGAWADWREVMNATVDLPGVLGPRRAPGFARPTPIPWTAPPVASPAAIMTVARKEAAVELVSEGIARLALASRPPPPGSAGWVARKTSAEVTSAQQSSAKRRKVKKGKKKGNEQGLQSARS